MTDARIAEHNGWPSQQPVWPTTQPSPASMSLPQMQRLQDERLPVTREGLLMLWQRTAETLAKAKEDEMQIRGQVAKAFFPTPKEGMNNFDLGNGYTLKFGNKMNYSLDKDKVDAALDAIEKAGDQGKFIAGRLVKFQPELSLTEYRLLEDGAATDALTKRIKAEIDSVLTIKPGTPSLEIKEPKNK